MTDLEIIAHRGSSGCYGDNNLESIQKAIKTGCRIIEIDIRLTSDNILVLWHDSIKKINGKNFIIEQNKYRDICCEIISLREIVENTPQHILFYLDIKVNNNNEQISKYLKIFLKEYINRNFILASFDYYFIESFPLLDNIKLGIISEEYDEDIFEKNISKISYVILNSNCLSNNNINNLKTLYNVKLYVYTVNNYDNIEPYFKIIDGVITDYPEKFIK
uniref:GP-PDE domain-containing protein n=1 Tax=viral metagenome TaxID=1070528 RepID=A0A6C0LXR1_9ZZZZ